MGRKISTWEMKTIRTAIARNPSRLGARPRRRNADSVSWPRNSDRSSAFRVASS